MGESQMRDFITGVLRDMEGNAVLALSSGRADPTETTPLGKLKVDLYHWFHYPTELDMMVAFAEKAHADGRDAYISPIIYGSQPFVNKKGETIARTRDDRPIFARSKSNAIFAQTVYMDSDACPPEAFRVPPSRHVQTSDGHGHDYWFLPTPVPARLAAEVGHKITTAHKEDGCDPSGWSANKVLRLPTWNTSYDELDPFPVAWEDDDVDPATGETGIPKVYALEDIQDIYSDVEVEAGMDEWGKELPPVPPLEGLPDFESLAARIPQAEKRLNDLLYKKPKLGSEGWRSEQRFALLLDLKRYGFTDEETVSLAWHSPAAAKFREEQRGVNGLWWELQAKVHPILAKEAGETISAAPPREEVVIDGPKLLTAEQRARVERRSDLVTLYLQHAQGMITNMNMPYHVINAWTLMSLGLSGAADINIGSEPLQCNIYSYTIGGSSSGKDEANNVLKPFVKLLFPNEEIEIAANATPEAYITFLHERDGKVAYIPENEVDGLLSQLAERGTYTKGIMQHWTRSYDGDVPPLARMGNRELNRSGIRATPVQKFIGTPAGVFAVLTRKMFFTGYLARVIWVLGEETEATRDTVRTKLRRNRRNAEHPILLPRYMALHLMRLREKLLEDVPIDEPRTLLEPTDEAAEMLDDAKWALTQFFATHDDRDLWKTVTRRMGDIMWKFAGLSAAMNGRDIIFTTDVEVALYYAETWMTNAISVSQQIADTHFSRQCDEIEKFLAAQPEQMADLGSIYRFRRGDDKFTTDKYLQSLVFQGRISATKPDGVVEHYRIKERKIA